MDVPTLAEHNEKMKEIWNNRHTEGFPKLAGVLCDSCKRDKDEEVEMRIPGQTETKDLPVPAVRVYCPECRYSSWKIGAY